MALTVRDLGSGFGGAVVLTLRHMLLVSQQGFGKYTQVNRDRGGLGVTFGMFAVMFQHLHLGPTKVTALQMPLKQHPEFAREPIQTIVKQYS